MATHALSFGDLRPGSLSWRMAHCTCGWKLLVNGKRQGTVTHQDHVTEVRTAASIVPPADPTGRNWAIPADVAERWRAPVEAPDYVHVKRARWEELEGIERRAIEVRNDTDLQYGTATEVVLHNTLRGVLSEVE